MYQAFKRICDLILSALSITILSPLLIPVMIGLKLTGEGYIFYLQERVGYKNQLFNIYKFATMLLDSPNMKGGAITMKNDPRITPMGGFLRKSKINELPQLFNILLGDMSFVGPRPVMKKQSFDLYPEDVKQVIYNVKPGLTGIGSLVFRDEEQIITDHVNSGGNAQDFYKNEIYPHKGKVEQWYQENQSFLTDLKILILTAWTVLFPTSQKVYDWFPDLPFSNTFQTASVATHSNSFATLSDQPKVSIITVSWNSAETIHTAINSVRFQTYPNIEYIIVDGDSSDGTKDVLEENADVITKMISEPDKGIYDAMNKGLEMATGEIVGFLNSDDFYAHNNVVKQIVETLKKNETDSVYGDLKYVKRDKLDKVIRYWKAKPYKRKRFLLGWMPPHPTFYAKSEIYRKFGNFNIILRNSADYELMLRFLFKHYVSSSYINDVLVIMRDGGASNNSIKSRLNANFEDRKAWRINNLHPRFYTGFLKPVRKIKQFFS